MARMSEPEHVGDIIKRMSKKQWQEHHGFDDDDMERITNLKEIFNGTITGVFDKMKIYVFDEKKQSQVLAGELINGDFIKNVVRSKHYLRIVSGYAISKEAVDKINGMCENIIINEADTKNTFTIKFTDFLENSKTWSHGHGEQKTISEKFLTKKAIDK